MRRRNGKRIIQEGTIGLDFKDISLVSHEISEISSRENVTVNSKLGNYILNCPIIASCMKDVTNSTVAKIMSEHLGIAVHHRFSSIEDQVKECTKYPSTYAAAIGINGDNKERYTALAEAGCRLFVIDVANAAQTSVRKTILDLLDISKFDCSFIVGNVVSDTQFKWAAQLPNVVGIRIGVAGGAACTTRNATGIYCPAITLLDACYTAKKQMKSDVAIIMDGGIKEPQDFCKSIVMGADFVMVGQQIAQTIESPAELIKIPLSDKEHKYYKVYHGSASFEIQKTYKDKPKYIEGKTKLLEYTSESLHNMLNRYMDGLKSCMSYFNANTLEELRNNSTVIMVS